eukprot:TRINITY_DN8752_c0_g1_i1.p1 TRINITY_DN8752_c0_g1~~TRINITY_DN8752_c0_g1_i1.p1  ORF type:complete len:642 (+),score=193.07 TRINITY_DN8752_c0_g1_i1:144-2069(+)
MNNSGLSLLSSLRKNLNRKNSVLFPLYRSNLSNRIDGSALSGKMKDLSRSNEKFAGTNQILHNRRNLTLASCPPSSLSVSVGFSPLVAFKSMVSNRNIQSSSNRGSFTSSASRHGKNFDESIFPSFKNNYRPLPENPRDRITPIPEKYLDNPPKEYSIIQPMINRSEAITDEEFEKIMVNLFPRPSKISKLGVGVSGGVDSMALVFLLHNWCKKMKIKLRAFVVDHKVRPESEAEAQLVKTRLTNMGISVEVLVVDWDKDAEFIPLRSDTVIGSDREAEVRSKSLTQEDFRLKRHTLFKIACKRSEICYLLLGQHFDDCVETLFMRIALGSGVTGYSTIESWRQVDTNYAIVRPLLRFNKSQLEETCKVNGVEWVTDPSNQSDVYYRNRVRKIVNSPGFWNKIPKEDFAFFINQMNQHKHSMNVLVDEFVSRYVTQDMWFGHLTMNNVLLFSSFNTPFAARILSHLIKQISSEPYYFQGKLEAMVNKIKDQVIKEKRNRKAETTLRLTVGKALFILNVAENKMTVLPASDFRNEPLVPLIDVLHWKNFTIKKTDEIFKGECFVRQAKPQDFAKMFKIAPKTKNFVVNPDVRISLPVVVDKQNNLLAIPHFRCRMGLSCSVHFSPIAGGIHNNLELIYQGPK